MVLPTWSSNPFFYFDCAVIRDLGLKIITGGLSRNLSCLIGLVRSVELKTNLFNKTDDWILLLKGVKCEESQFICWLVDESLNQWCGLIFSDENI